MKLIVRELITNIDQQITSPSSTSFLYAIRPHIYRHNVPSGSLRVQILDTNLKLIGQSALLPITSIDLEDGSAPNNFYHGYVRFVVSVPLKASTNYFVRLTHSGYTFSAGAFIGWCNDYDLQKYPRSYTPANDWDKAMDMEFWTTTRQTRSA